MNSEKTIQRTIESVLSQNYEVIEHIFVDGGSSDSTLSIIQKYIDLIKSENLNIVVKIIFQKDKTGIAGAWNLALEKNTGDIIHMLNSDDWYEPNTISYILDTFTKYPNIGIVYASAYFYTSEKSKYIRYCRPLLLFPFLMPVAHPSVFVRKSIIKKIGVFDITYSISSDYDFLYRCYKKGVKFFKVSLPLVNMQLGGLANLNRNIARQETLKVALKHSTFSFFPYAAYFLRKILKR